MTTEQMKEYLSKQKTLHLISVWQKAGVDTSTKD